jgi:type II secretory pathway pseudopilin PulG
MTTTPRPNAVEAAKQGNPKAIEVLLNQALKSSGQTARVIRNADALRILVEGEMAPDELTIAHLIETGLRHLDLGEITPQVQLYGQQLGQSLPVWTQSINLGADDVSASIFSFDTVTVDLPQSAPEPIAAPSHNRPRPTVTNHTSEIDTPEMPKTYLTPAIVLLLLTIFPFSLVSLIFAAQVASKHERGDYAGAESASRNAKLWCWINVGIATPVYLLVGGLIIVGVAAFSGTVAHAQQEREATDRLKTMMRVEQAYYLENNQFTPNPDALTRLPASPQATTGKPIYTYKVTILDPKSVQITAIPNRKDFHSLTAGAMIMGTNAEDMSVQSIVCGSEKASMSAVKMPIIKGASLGCAPGSKPPASRPPATAADPDESSSDSPRSASDESEF